MGTHPIFESDFDCLTESSGMKIAILLIWALEGSAFKKEFELQTCYNFAERQTMRTCRIHCEINKDAECLRAIYTNRLEDIWETLKPCNQLYHTIHSYCMMRINEE